MFVYILDNLENVDSRVGKNVRQVQGIIRNRMNWKWVQKKRKKKTVERKVKEGTDFLSKTLEELKLDVKKQTKS